MPYFRLLFIFLFPFLISSCISNKKHRAAVELLNNEHQTALGILQKQISTDQQNIKGLELNLAERIGENNILIMLRTELQAEITALKQNIETLDNTSTSKQQDLSASLQKKDQRIKVLNQLLEDIETAIAEQENLIRQMTDNLNLIAQDHPEYIEVNLGFDFATIDIKESFLFKNNSTTRLEDEGFTLLEKFSEIFQKYPSVNVQVIGHTDTAPPKDKKRYGDNWNFSALQSATIVRTLIDDYDVSANQLTLSAKAEFSPKASNASSEGKSKNRRIEMLLTLDTEDLAKRIRTIIAKKD